MAATIARTTVEIHGPALRQIRLLSSVSVRDLAERIKKDRSYIAHLELGHKRRVSPEVFNDLVAALALPDRRAILVNPYGEQPEEAPAA